ncbi:hypothetical protein RRG08_056723 [Elysia crispata]|uniref:Uncharacterized protein n=1 Tax=Elysia crispata TaxID=231223 RepID=A0AAE0YHC2_9GAST|nr:hypothetical protein RRG08_056723 [Elysia crispata]
MEVVRESKMISFIIGTNMSRTAMSVPQDFLEHQRTIQTSPTGFEHHQCMDCRASKEKEKKLSGQTEKSDSHLYNNGVITRDCDSLIFARGRSDAGVG